MFGPVCSKFFYLPKSGTLTILLHTDPNTPRKSLLPTSEILFGWPTVFYYNKTQAPKEVVSVEFSSAGIVACSEECMCLWTSEIVFGCPAVFYNDKTQAPKEVVSVKFSSAEIGAFDEECTVHL